MITAETAPAGGTLSGAPGRPAHRHAKIVISAFFLAAFFIFTGAPTANTAAAVFASNMTNLGEPSPPCRGDKAGVCPYYYEQPGSPTTDNPNTGRPGEQNTTSESPTP